MHRWYWCMLGGGAAEVTSYSTCRCVDGCTSAGNFVHCQNKRGRYVSCWTALSCYKSSHRFASVDPILRGGGGKYSRRRRLWGRNRRRPGQRSKKEEKAAGTLCCCPLPKSFRALLQIDFVPCLYCLVTNFLRVQKEEFV